MGDVDQLRADMLREFGAINRRMDASEKRVDKKLDQVVNEAKGARAAAARVVDRQTAIDQRVANHARRLGAVERREEERSAAEPGPNWQAETTGVYELQALVEEREDRRSESKHLRRQARGWVVSAIGWVVALIIATAIASYSARASAPSSHPQGTP